MGVLLVACTTLFIWLGADLNFVQNFANNMSAFDAHAGIEPLESVMVVRENLNVVLRNSLTTLIKHIINIVKI